MQDITVCDHASPHYSPRTWHNAKTADLTVALALNFNTAGERLTHKAAGSRYLSIPLEDAPAEAARKILDDLAQRKLKHPVINIAGNGIYSLSGKGWDQHKANQHLYDILSVVNQHQPIARIISGGQTGVDLAGIVAACVLNIPAVATLPKGFIQRSTDGQDRTHSMEEIIAMVVSGVDKIRHIEEVLVVKNRHAPFKPRRR